MGCPLVHSCCHPCFLYLPSKVRTYFGSCPLKSDCKNPSLYEVSGSKNDDGNLKKHFCKKLKKRGSYFLPYFKIRRLESFAVFNLTFLH